MLTKIKRRNKNDDYILGEGDVISISISEFTPELDRKVQIGINGKVNLPRINNVYISGLTIEELRKILNQKYKEFLQEPNISIDIISYRPMRVLLKGEISIPGFYVLSSSMENINNLSSAIKLAGGLTNNADIKNITIKRKTSDLTGNKIIEKNINLLNVLKDDLSKDISLRDKDVIEINRSQKSLVDELKLAISTNLSPKLIKVNVVGNVNFPGIKEIPRVSSLNDAIFLSGSKKIFSGRVMFIRFDSNGTIERRIFKYKKNEKPGTYKNPYLSNGDLIFVGNSAIRNFGEGVDTLTKPFTSIFGLYELIQEVSD